MHTATARSIVQNCYVVRDLDEACARFHALFGIGPFVGGAEVELSDHVYRGRVADPITLRGVFVQSGDLNIELVQLISTGASAFRDMFPRDEEGLHHAAMFADSYDDEKARWAEAGHPVVSEFTTGFGAKICYIDARAELGHFIELYPEHPTIRAMYSQTVEEARIWDGHNLIVPWQ